MADDYSQSLYNQLMAQQQQANFQQQQFQVSAMSTMNQMQNMLQTMQLNQQQQVMMNASGMNPGFMQGQMGGFTSAFGVNPAGLMGALAPIGRTMGNIGSSMYTGYLAANSGYFAAGLRPEQRERLATTMGTNTMDAMWGGASAVSSVAKGAWSIGSWFMNPMLAIGTTLGLPLAGKIATSPLMDLMQPYTGVGRAYEGWLHPIDSIRNQLKENTNWVNYLGENSYMFAGQSMSNWTHPGLTQRGTQDYAKAIRNFAPKFHISQQEVDDVLPTLIENGMMRGTDGLEQFTSRFGDLIKHIKNAATILGKSYGDVANLMAEWQKSGLSTANFDLESAKLKMYGAQMGKSVDFMAGWTLDWVHQNQQGTTQSTENVASTGQETLKLVTQMRDNAVKTGNTKVTDLLASVGGVESGAQLFNSVKSQVFGGDTAAAFAPGFFTYQNGKFNFDNQGFKSAIEGLSSGAVSADSLYENAASRVKSWGPLADVMWTRQQKDLLMNLDSSTQNSMLGFLVNATRQRSRLGSMDFSNVLQTFSNVSPNQGDFVQALMDQYGKTGFSNILDQAFMPLASLGSTISQTMLADMKSGTYYKTEQSLIDMSNKLAINPANRISNFFSDKMKFNTGQVGEQIEGWAMTRNDYDIFTDSGARRQADRMRLLTLSPMSNLLYTFNPQLNSFLGSMQGNSQVTVPLTGNLNLGMIKGMLQDYQKTSGTDMTGIINDVLGRGTSAGNHFGNWLMSAIGMNKDNMTVGNLQVSGANASAFNQAMLTELFKGMANKFAENLNLSDMYKVVKTSTNSSVANAIISNSATHDNSLGETYAEKFKAIQSDLDAASAKYGVDQSIIKAFTIEETGATHTKNGQVRNAGSDRGIGIMAIDQASNPSPGEYDLYNQHDNIMAGTKLLRDALDYYGGNVGLVAYSYNTGRNGLADAYRMMTGGKDISQESKDALRNLDVDKLIPYIRQVNLAGPYSAYADSMSKYAQRMISDIGHLGGSAGSGTYDLNAYTGHVVDRTEFHLDQDTLNGTIGTLAHDLSLNANGSTEWNMIRSKLNQALQMKSTIGTYQTLVEDRTRPEKIDYQGISGISGDLNKLMKNTPDSLRGRMQTVLNSLDNMSHKTVQEVSDSWVQQQVNQLDDTIKEFDGKVEDGVLKKLKGVRDFFNSYRDKVTTSLETHYESSYISQQKGLLKEIETTLGQSDKVVSDARTKASDALNRYETVFSRTAYGDIGKQTAEDVITRMTTASAYNSTIQENIFGGNWKQQGAIFSLQNTFGMNGSQNAAILNTMSDTQLRALQGIVKDASLGDTKDGSALSNLVGSLRQMTDENAKQREANNVGKTIADFLSKAHLNVSLSDNDRKLLSQGNTLLSSARDNVSNVIRVGRPTWDTIMGSEPTQATNMANIGGTAEVGFNQLTSIEDEMRNVMEQAQNPNLDPGQRQALVKRWQELKQQQSAKTFQVGYAIQSSNVSSAQAMQTGLGSLNFSDINSSIQQRLDNVYGKSAWDAKGMDRQTAQILSKDQEILAALTKAKTTGDVSGLKAYSQEDYRQAFADAGVRLEGGVKSAVESIQQLIRNLDSKDRLNGVSPQQPKPEIINPSKAAGGAPSLGSEEFSRLARLATSIDNGQSSLTGEDLNKVLAGAAAGGQYGFQYRALLNAYSNPVQGIRGASAYKSLINEYNDQMQGRGGKGARGVNAAGGTEYLKIGDQMIPLGTDNAALDPAQFIKAQTALMDKVDPEFKAQMGRQLATITQKIIQDKNGAHTYGSYEQNLGIIQALSAGTPLDQLKQKFPGSKLLESDAVSSLTSSDKYKAYGETAASIENARKALNEIRSGQVDRDSQIYDMGKFATEVKDTFLGLFQTNVDNFKKVISGAGADLSNKSQEQQDALAKIYINSTQELMKQIQDGIQLNPYNAEAIVGNVKNNVEGFYEKLAEGIAKSTGADSESARKQVLAFGATQINTLADKTQIGIAHAEQKYLEDNGAGAANDEQYQRLKDLESKVKSARSKTMDTFKDEAAAIGELTSALQEANKISGDAADTTGTALDNFNSKLEKYTGQVNSAIAILDSKIQGLSGYDTPHPGNPGGGSSWWGIPKKVGDFFSGLTTPSSTGNDFSSPGPLATYR